MTTPLHLANWSGPRVAAACHDAYTQYRAEKTESYRAYFARNSSLKAEDHEYKAKDLAAALPEQWAHLAEQVPVNERHRHHLSGNSSQVLALGLLGIGKELDPSLKWLWDALGPLPPPKSASPTTQFERTL